MLFLVPVALGALIGDVHVVPGAGERFAVLFTTGLIARLTFAAFEEFGWRGYLEPRLAALGVPALRRHLAVGVLWAVWHVPYIVAFGDAYTTLPLAVQIPMFSVAVLAMAVIWGVARDRTGSVWPAVLGHGMANAVAWPLLAADVVVIDTPAALRRPAREPRRAPAPDPDGGRGLPALGARRRRYCPCMTDQAVARRVPWATVIGWVALLLAVVGAVGVVVAGVVRRRGCPGPAVLRHPRCGGGADVLADPVAAGARRGDRAGPTRLGATLAQPHHHRPGGSRTRRDVVLLLVVAARALVS